MHIRSRTDDFAGFDRPSGGQLQRAASSTDSSSSTDLDARVEVFKTPTSNESPTTGQGGKGTSISSLSPDNVTSQSLKRKLLLATGKVDADSKDNDGQAPLRRAAGNGHEAVAKLLLATGKVDADSKDMHGQTPLSWAAENGHEAMVKLQISCASREGADPLQSYPCDDDGRLAVAVA
jgi:ankyrin repeat protein